MGGATQTWGISGLPFLLAYLAVVAAVWLASTWARRALAEHGADRPDGDLAAHPHDVAFLNGGVELAVCSALCAMHRTGTIRTAGGRGVQAVGRLAPGRAPLERAVHFTAAVPVPRHRLPHHRPVVSALREIEDRLVDGGLLLSEQQRDRIRTVGWWMVAVAALGLLRLLAEVANARPVGLLATVLIAAAAVGGAQLAAAPRRSRAGDRALAELRRTHHELAPKSSPDRSSHGPTAAALAVGVFGTGALWSTDPVFAGEPAAQKLTSASGGGYGGYSDGGGGFGGFDAGGACDGGE